MSPRRAPAEEQARLCADRGGHDGEVCARNLEERRVHGVADDPSGGCGEGDAEERRPPLFELSSNKRNGAIARGSALGFELSHAHATDRLAVALSGGDLVPLERLFRIAVDAETPFLKCLSKVLHRRQPLLACCPTHPI